VADSAVVNVVFKARDEASAEVRKLAGELGALPGAASRIISAAGPIGLFAGALASGGAAAIAAGKAFSDEAVALDRISRGAGTTAQNVQVLQATYKRFGLDADQATTALQFMARAIAQHPDRLKALGVQSRDAFQAILQLGDRFAKSGDAAQHAGLLAELLGKQWRTLTGIAPQLRQATEEVRSEMESTGALMSDVMIARGKTLHQTFDLLALRWRGVWLEMAAAAVPSSITIVNSIDAILKGFDRLVKGGQKAKDDYYAIWSSLKPVAGLGPLGFGVIPIPGSGATGAQIKQRRELDQQIKDLLAYGLVGPVTYNAPDETLDKTTAAMKKHAALVQELIDLYPKMTKKVAEHIAKLEEEQELELKREAMAKKFPNLFPTIPVTEVRGATRETARKLLEQAAQQVTGEGLFGEKALIEQKPAITFAKITTAWEVTVMKQLELGTLLQDGLTKVYQSLESTVYTVFSNIFARGQTLGRALATVFKGIGDAFLQVISHIVATEMFKLFLSLLKGVVFGFGGAIPDIGDLIPSRAGRPIAPNTNITINALSPNSVLSEMLNPGGSMRRANLRLAEVTLR
jgi:hypothetical protein